MGLSFDLGTPINTALFFYILYSVQRIIFPSTSTPKTIPNEFKAGYSWMPKAHPPTVLFKTYTPKTLEPFSGKDGGRILLAINGTVFDVTAGRNFYGPSTLLSFPCVHIDHITHPLRWHVRKFCWA
jgi:membrane-associated progesterone receptor component